MVDLERAAALLHHAVLHHDHAITERHRLFLIVRDVDRGGVQAHVQLLDLGAHLDAQLGVEIRQRLVEQKALRVAHDGAAHRHALALTAGKRLGLSLEQLLDAQDLGGALDLLVDRRASARPRSLSANAMFSYTVMCG